MLSKLLLNLFFAMFQDEFRSRYRTYLAYLWIRPWSYFSFLSFLFFFVYIVGFVFRSLSLCQSLKDGLFFIRSFVLYRILISVVLLFLYRWRFFICLIVLYHFFFYSFIVGFSFSEFCSFVNRVNRCTRG